MPSYTTKNLCSFTNDTAKAHFITIISLAEKY